MNWEVIQFTGGYFRLIAIGITLIKYAADRQRILAGIIAATC